jgi:ATP phosphoribosyltransferase
MNRPLIIAVPSKGRLQDNAAAFFARAGLSIRQSGGARDYRASVEGLEGVDIAFLSASDIASQLASGQVHLGVTGEDLLRENIPDADKSVLLLCPLGFGHANVVVAAPRAWIDVRSMRDLDEVAADMRARTGRHMRVATKYLNLTRQFFTLHGLSDYALVESPGATEGAPAAGVADIIVDITTTGATLAANGLKIIDDGTMLRSQANLAASLTASWDEDTQNLARIVLSRIAAEEEARLMRDIQVLSSDSDGVMGVASRYEAVLLYSAQGVLTLRCPASQALPFAQELLLQGASDVSIRAQEAIFKPGNELELKLSQALST